MEKDQSLIKKFDDGIVKFSDEDKDLNTKLDALVEEGKSLHDSKLKVYSENQSYFNGTVKYVDQSGRQFNRITNFLFPRIRTMVGLETDSFPKPVVKPPLYLAMNEDGTVDSEKRAELIKKAQSVKEYVEQRWQKIKGQSILTKVYFQKHKYNDAFLMPKWNFEIDDYDFESISPKQVMIDPNADNIFDAEWVRVKWWKNKKFMLSMFGDVAKQLTYEAKPIDDNDEDNKSGTGVSLEMFLFDKFFIYRVGDKILKKIVNPYFNYDTDVEQYLKFIDGKESYIDQFEKIKKHKTEVVDGEEKPMMDESGNPILDIYASGKEFDSLKPEELADGFKPVNNYFRFPRKPLIQFKQYDDGEGFYSYPGFEQHKRLADDIEDTKQQIKRYRENVADPSLIYNSSNVTEEDARKVIKRQTGQAYGIPLESDQSLHDNILIDSGKEMPSSVFENLQDSQKKLDESIGNNDVSRGVSDPSNPTARGIEAVQRADQTPIRLLTRNDEDSMQEVFEWCLQFIALFYTKKNHYIEQETEEDGQIHVPIMASDIISGMEIFTKTGSTMPIDRFSQRESARNDAAAGLIAPQSYYELNPDYDEPKIQANRLLNWKNGVISDKPTQDNSDQMMNDPNFQLAMSQNKEMMIGRNIDIVPGEDSRIHWDVHTKGLKEVDNMPDGPEKESAKAAFIEHLKETEYNLKLQGNDPNKLLQTKEPPAPVNQIKQ